MHLACIVQADAKGAAEFCGLYGLEDRCLPDPHKETYQAMGLGRTSLKEILFPSPDLKRRRKQARQAGARMNLRGTFQKHSDVWQLPGAALVGEDGKILWLHRGTHTGDLPSAEKLLEVVDKHLAASSPSGEASA